MLKVELVPAAIPITRKTDLLIRTSNPPNNRVCTSIVLDFHVPTQLRFVGRRSVKLDRLEAGDYADHKILVWAKDSGKFDFRISNFSYRDFAGVTCRQDSFSLSIKAVDRGAPNSPPSKSHSTKESASYRPIRIFYSYSHEDQYFLHVLRQHLSVMRTEGIIVDNYDGDIPPGNSWPDSIENLLHSADIIVLLISSKFLSSEMCNKEKQIAFGVSTVSNTRLVPVIVSDCQWRIDPVLNNLNALPLRGDSPITSWEREDEAFKNVADGLLHLVQSIRCS